MSLPLEKLSDLTPRHTIDIERPWFSPEPNRQVALETLAEYFNDNSPVAQALQDHIDDPTAAHAASAISTSGGGNVEDDKANLDENGKLPADELPDEIDARVQVLSGTDAALATEVLALGELAAPTDGAWIRKGDGVTPGGVKVGDISECVFNSGVSGSPGSDLGGSGLVGPSNALLTPQVGVVVSTGNGGSNAASGTGNGGAGSAPAFIRLLRIDGGNGGNANGNFSGGQSVEVLSNTTSSLIFLSPGNGGNAGAGGNGGSAGALMIGSSNVAFARLASGSGGAGGTGGAGGAGGGFATSGNRRILDFSAGAGGAGGSGGAGGAGGALNGTSNFGIINVNAGAGGAGGSGSAGGVGGSISASVINIRAGNGGNGGASGETGGAGGGVGAITLLGGNGAAGTGGSPGGAGGSSGSLNLSGGNASGTTPGLAGGSIDLSNGGNTLTIQGTAGQIGHRVAVPANSAATGAVGQWASDDNYIYFYGATGWRRVAGASF